MLTRWVKKGLLLLDSPWNAALIAAGIYVGFAFFDSLWEKPTFFNFYSYLADAFWHGQINLRLIPANTMDLLHYQGKVYLYRPPLPAVFLIPFVAIWGVQISYLPFTLGLGVLDVGLVALLLRVLNQKEILHLSPLQRGIIVFAFAFGTPFAIFPASGHIWLFGQLLAITFSLLAYLSALGGSGVKAFMLTGLWLAAVLATRTQMVFLGLWPLYYLSSQQEPTIVKARLKHFLALAAPLFVAVVLLMTYNWLRFGSVIDTGYEYQEVDLPYLADIKQYGQFNLVYIPRNLDYHWLSYPFLSQEANGIFKGGSLFLMSPIFFSVGWAFWNHRRQWTVWVLVITCILVYIPSALHINSGYVQMGSRYLMDFIVPLLILTGMGIQYWPDRTSGYLAMISFVNFFAGNLIYLKFTS